MAMCGMAICGNAMMRETDIPDCTLLIACHGGDMNTYITIHPHLVYRNAPVVAIIIMQTAIFCVCLCLCICWQHQRNMALIAIGTKLKRNSGCKNCACRNKCARHGCWMHGCTNTICCRRGVGYVVIFAC